MGNVCPNAEDMDRIRQAANEVLDDPVFARSPVLSRLLAYLVEMTARRAPIKSYTIAMDGLGKSEQDMGDVDTYARVAVARLRKALSAYYAAHPQSDELIIDSGTYEVRVKSAAWRRPQQATASAQPVAPPPPAPPLPGRRRPKACQLVAAAMGILALGLAIWHFWTRQSPEAYKVNDFPTVSVAANPAKGIDWDSEAHRQALSVAFDGYPSVRLVDAAVAKPDYQVRIYLSAQASEPTETISLLDSKSGRIIWSQDYPHQPAQKGESSAQQAAFAIAGPAGALNGFARRPGYKANSPYGCWLRFTELIQTYNTIGDDSLNACADAWYEAAPQRPLAAMLHGWTLTDRSLVQLGEARRRAKLAEALRVLHRAATLNPDIAALHIAEMRAYSHAGNRRMVKEAAGEALEDAQGNRLIIGMAASGLAMWNDPGGAALLRTLHSEGDRDVPWEHVALFVTAMMHEDVAAAGTQIDHLENFNTGQPMLLLFKSAYLARTGKQAEAEAILQQLRSNPRVLIVGKEEMIARMPLAPEVKARMRQWMATGQRK